MLFRSALEHVIREVRYDHRSRTIIVPQQKRRSHGTRRVKKASSCSSRRICRGAPPSFTKSAFIIIPKVAVSPNSTCFIRPKYRPIVSISLNDSGCSVGVRQRGVNQRNRFMIGFMFKGSWNTARAPGLRTRAISLAACSMER